MAEILVRKLNTHGEETWRYTGEVIKRRPGYLLLEGRFNRPNVPFHGILLKEGDRFVEEYHADRWYNVFEIHDRDDDRIKGWYCNITYPAIIEEQSVSYTDLALDLLVYPDGRQLILDQHEFEALDLPPKIQVQALATLEELQAIFHEKI